MMGFGLADLSVGATIDIQQEKKTGRNVLARLAVGALASPSRVIIGAHIDHLGTGHGAHSLARGAQKGGVHYGADETLGKCPQADGHPAYDSYTHLDVQDKWVLVFRYLPEGISQEFRQHLNRYASLRRKAMLARDHGARGLIVVSGPNAKVKNQLVSLSFDASLAGETLGISLSA